MSNPKKINPRGNDPCRCGSHRKYKDCHQDTDRARAADKRALHALIFFGVLIGLIVAYWAVAVVVGKPPAHPGASSVGFFP